MSDAARRALAARLLDALPQTQCARCGYLDCAAYAEAIADGQAAINQCPPGGAEGIRRLAGITGQAALPLNTDNGVEGPRGVAWIDEDWCIGCTLCIKACPVDCIIGTHKRMHTVIESQCTGCELCVPACPVDCIAMESVTGSRTGWDAWSAQDAADARARHAATTERRRRAGQEQAERLEPIATGGVAHPPAPGLGAGGTEPDRKRSAIEAALARARAKRGDA